MLHQRAILCNNLLQNIFNCTKLHHGNQNVEVAATGEHMSKEAMKRISDNLKKAGATLPAPEITGTIEGSMITGLCIALAIVEQEIEALAEQPAQQEPVSWCSQCGHKCPPAQQQEPAQQEPVYVYTCKGCQSLFWENCVSCDCTVDGLMEFDRHVLSGSTSPPAQRTWVGLTDEEIAKAVGEGIYIVYLPYFRAIEAKLKEKNT
jgi:hypothetical protein